MNSYKYVILILNLILIFSVSVMGQKILSEETYNCVNLRSIGQTPYAAEKIKTPNDVIVAVPDDILVRFELKNDCDRPIYFITTIVLDTPWAYWIYREDTKGEWKSRSPAWRRDGGPGGSTMRWLLLAAGRSIAFEGTDLTKIEGERSLAIYINSRPKTKGMTEILAEPFSINSGKQ